MIADLFLVLLLIIFFPKSAIQQKDAKLSFISISYISSKECFVQRLFLILSAAEKLLYSVTSLRDHCNPEYPHA